MSHLSVHDCILVRWKMRSNFTNWDKGLLVAVRFFRTVAQPCIKWWEEQACNLINALKMVKMDNERAKSQMAQSVCLLGTLTAYWSAKVSLGQGQSSDAVRGDEYRTVVNKVYSEIDLHLSQLHRPLIEDQTFCWVLDLTFLWSWVGNFSPNTTLDNNMAIFLLVGVDMTQLLCLGLW